MKKEELEKIAYTIHPNDNMNDEIYCDLGEYHRELWLEGANYVAERMYSEEEVIKIVEKSRETGLTAEYLLLTEQFKKK
jgi:hypothetical protein